MVLQVKLFLGFAALEILNYCLKILLILRGSLPTLILTYRTEGVEQIFIL
jgi:hypothetical protein